MLFRSVLRDFYRLIRPDGPGWRRVREQCIAEGVPGADLNPKDSLTRGLLGFFLGVLSVYCGLFGIGEWIYGKALYAALLLGVALLSMTGLAKLFFLCPSRQSLCSEHDADT